MNILKNTAVIVGSGIAGILSAIMLKKKFKKVYLIEKGPHLGGLLSSYKTESGYEFDYGTHFLRETGIADLDSILYGELSPDKWIKFGNLKAGNYFCSKLNEKSPFVDTRLLSRKDYEKGMIQLLHSGGLDKSHNNLEEYLKYTLGEIFTEKIYNVAAKKFLCHELKDLVPDSIGLIFILARVIGFTPEITRELKKSPLFDKKLAFHSSEEGQSKLNNFYPLKGGVGLWIHDMEKKLIKIGVKILKNTQVKKINRTNGNIISMNINNGSLINCDQLIWTAPVFQCIKVGGLNPSFRVTAPNRMKTSIFHFVFDQPFLTNLHYFVCFDPDITPFRITLYSNIQNMCENNQKYRLTAEVLSPEEIDLGKTSKKVIKDLKKMGIIPRNANVLFNYSEMLTETFPVPTPQFVNDSKIQLDFAKENFKNSLFLGKNVGNSWFMQDILVQTFNTLKKL